MNSIQSKPSLLRAGVAALALWLAGGAAVAATVQLTAAPTSTTLPDGQSVPMWGYSCGASTDATCTAANGSPQSGTTWQPPLITVPAGPLTVTLFNKLSFGAAAGQQIPTSLVIVGQVGGGLGSPPARMPSPVHAPQGTTWPGTLGNVDSTVTAAITVGNPGKGYVTPPAVSFSGGGGGTGASAAAAVANGSVSSVTVATYGSGYLSAPTVTIDPPPCVINTTTCIRATATMDFSIAQSSSGDATFVPPAQADRVRSFATEVPAAADGSSSQDLTWSNLRPGTYLIHSGTQPSIQHPMGLYAVLVVTEPATTTGAAQAYGANFDKDLALLFSEIDPVQNREVDQVVRNAGFSDTAVWSGLAGGCGDVTQPSTAHTCYPPAVNYSPTYYLVNGASFDRTNLAGSTLTVGPAAAQGKLLLRLVNAGLRLHVPSVVNKSMTLLAEDGNKLPGAPRVQASVALQAGKTYDVTIQPAPTTPGATTYADATIAVFDRQLSLSTSNQRDGGMQAYIQIGAGATAGAGSASSATTLTANAKTYYCTSGTTLAITDPAKGLLGGAVGANGLALGAAFTGDASAATVALNSNGTFTYTPSSATSCGGSFSFVVNGTASRVATITQCDAASHPVGCPYATAATVGPITFTSNVASRYASPIPGVLSAVTNYGGGLSLSAVGGGATGGTVTVNPDGSFVAVPGAGITCPVGTVASSTCMSFAFQAKNAQGTLSNSATATVVFLPASNLAVNVWDAPSTKPGKTKAAISDYRWIIEEDRTFWIDPKCQVNSTLTRTDARGLPCPALPVESLGYNFHSANMPVVAQGCVGKISCESGQTINNGTPTACDIGNGICATDGSKTQKPETLPSSVYLDPNKRYFISILPGDGVNATIGGAGGPDGVGKPFSIAAACGTYDPNKSAWMPGNLGDADGNNTAICGHAMGGKQIAAGQRYVDIALQQTPLPTAKIAVFVFQDDNPLNGENDAGGGVDVIAPNEPGLGGFEIKLFDQAGGLGDATGQITYDMFNQPVSNALANQKDPITGLDACPINARGDRQLGMIPTCPKYEADGVTPSPLAGQVVIGNLYPGLYEVVATPAADRIARGEEWLQTNTLDGGKPHEAFIKPNEPGYFQEFGPGGFHVSIGFASPALINARKAAYCASPANAGGAPSCNNTLNVQVTNNHMSRTPDQRTFSTETYDHFSFTQCYVSIGPADGNDFAFEKCSPEGNVSFTGMPPGVFKITVFDQWNDIMLDGLVGTVAINSGTTEKTFPVTQWRTNLFTRTFIDSNGDGVSQETEPGLALVNTNIHYRDGSIGFFNNTDLNGYAGFNEVFPFMNWLVVETTATRFKPTGVHTVYDAGGTVDGSTQSAGQAHTPGWSTSEIAKNIANTDVRIPLPTELRAPGARYCDNADCTTGSGGASTGTVFPPQPFGTTQGWQGLLGQNSFIEFGVKPFNPGENGGIHGQVIYASTRPFDDPALSLQLSWEPGVPRAKINLYSKTVDASGNEVLKLVDTTTSASWDDWTQGFRKDANGVLMTAADGGYIPNINCPGQDNGSPFFATLKDSKEWLDADKRQLAYHSQFKCYDGWSQLNQVQPAPYDGLYKFPSVVTVGTDGKPAISNCHMQTAAEPWGCVPNTAATSTDWDAGKPMLPAGKYVVEVILPPGYELVKEEDKNILLGDVYIAPVTQQFAGFGNVFIMPDQAAVNSAYNPNNPNGLNKTTNLGATPRNEGDTGSVETFWPCVGAERIVPDLNSLFPGAGQQAPFAGAKRRLCDRKEVTLDDQANVLAKFFVFSSTHIAGHFTGTITNDFASEFDPFSPQFGEKFGPPNLPVGMRDFTGNEVARVYSDQWGIYNGLFFSSYSVNPPNPTGYVPQMAIACMNDPGPIPRTNASGQYVNAAGAVVASAYDADMITDPAYSPAYSNFCYETPFMPGFTAYMDTPVIPTQAFADGYNLPDTEYPDKTPVVKTVVNSLGTGPWVDVSIPEVLASLNFTIGGVSQQNNAVNASADRIFFVQVGSTTLTSALIRCGTSNVANPAVPVDCTAAGNGNAAQATRNNNMAAALRTNINAGTGTHGFSASGTAANVILTAAPGTGATLNGASLLLSQNGLNSVSGVVLAGGVTGHVPTTTAQLTITALGDKVVQNPAFSGPNATTAPYNQKTITRHYGFGDTVGTVSVVGSDGVARPLTGVSWSDTQITGTVPSTLPNCPQQQRNQANAQCGQLVITRADNGKQTIDSITVTVGGSSPWLVTASDVIPPAGKAKHDYTAEFGRMGFSPIQTAIDSADPGDLILVQPGTYRENLIMWKPLRLQGTGAGSVTINADAHPAGKMDQWRRQMNCVFGLDLDGVPNLDNAHYDASGTYSCPNGMHQRVDRIPFEAIVGWDASGNGNLAQVLQEPTLMGAYEGAGITVLGRGVRIPDNSTDFWGQQATGGAGAFTDGSVYLTNSIADCRADPNQHDSRDYGTGNFFCNPSRIDGVSVINSSQGGGGVFIHGWAHNLDVANTRIWGNHGTLAGAINLGNGETPDAFLNDGVECNVNPSVMPCPPTVWRNGGATTGNTRYSPATNAAIAFQFNTNVRVHHNMLYNNASIGDALFSGTPAGAGGITVSAGADGYRIDHNWIAGNLSTGDGGGVQHLGLSFQGQIDHNVVMYNQSTNPTLPTSGGGIVIEGANLDRQLNGTECGSITDQDCPPGLGEGTGAGLVIDGNLILGNSAESGTGGGLRIQQVNGSELIAFPVTNAQWYDVTVTNNIIANNVAGWDGGGVSIQDALKVSFVNNTVASNDTTASAGVLFKTLGAINSNTPPPGCTPTTDPTQPQNPNCTKVDAPHAPQPAGLVVQAHTPNLVSELAALPLVTCPPNGFGYTGLLGVNGDCRKLSRPKLINDLFWQNRAFRVDIVKAGDGLISQQNLVALSPALSQSSTGECAAGANYWDIGLRTDDLAIGGIPAGTKLTVANSIYTADPQGVITATNNRVGGSSPVNAQFCNGARMPPEHCIDSGIDQGGATCKGFNAPPGASETTGLTQRFVFNGIQPTATVDEGHNWLNLTYGPLTLGRPGVSTPTAGEEMLIRSNRGATSGAYAIPGTSAAVNGGSTGTGISQVSTDFFGNARGGRNDIGAAQFVLTADAAIRPAALGFGAVQLNTASPAQTLTLAAGSTAMTGINVAVTGPFSRTGGTCGATLGASTQAVIQTCTINIAFTPTAVGPVTGTVTVSSNVNVVGSPVSLTGAGVTIDLTLSPTALNLGSVAIGSTTAVQTVTLTNTSNPARTVTGITPTVSGTGFTRSTTSPGTCSTTAPFALNAAASCTINVQFTPTAIGAASGSVSVTADGGFSVSGSVGLSGTGVPARPSLTVLDNFNRANANTLGGSWSQVTLNTNLACTLAGLGTAPCANVRVNSNQAVDNGTTSSAYWTTGFGATQAAAYTVSNGTVTGAGLLLKANGGTAAVPVNFLRVRTTATQVIVESCSLAGVTCLTQATFSGATAAFTTNDVLTALANVDGTVDVWKNSTYLGRSTAAAAFTGTGRIGLQLPSGGRVDDFAGGTVP